MTKLFNLINLQSKCVCWFIIVVFTLHVPVFFLPSWHNFGEMVLKFCICCQLPSANKSQNFKTMV